MRSSTAVGFEAARGRLTSIPRDIIGAVSMKMSSRTSTTSTSGTMLISASEVPTRSDPPDDSVLNAIFRRPRELRQRAGEQVQEIEGEPLHLGGPVLHAIQEEVVADDGGDGGAEAGGGRDKGLR